ncbi:TPA: hypothetical protein L3V69_001429 [Vibrio parahaemolyticus]|nr:hypothetical protein [Vibrio parahaemolyticus]HBN6316414.1 hypothetical protein [Vibrio parahaemolyticus]HCD5128861.1 hypothetical protein [Vibrio parahaemolyticus]HCD5207934.1 hypothetical protein [Vibrio parahaemolyticus]
MSKVVNKSQFKRASVLSALSMVMLAGCQSTGNQVVSEPEPYRGGMTQTEETNLLRYRNTVNIEVAYDKDKFPNGDLWYQMSKEFKLSEPVSFEYPLTQMLDCGDDDNALNNQKGTLTITKAESTEKNWATTVHGYVSSDEFDVSKCTATVEFLVKDTSRKKGLIQLIAEGPHQKPAYGTGFATIAFPKLQAMKTEAFVKRYADTVQQKKQAQLADWHEKELADTAFAIAGVEVCMEKGTYFFPPNRQAKKVINDWQSYAKNDIRSKVDGKHYYDKSVYQQRRQAALKLLRYSWENDYLSFSNMCASLRNAVDSHTNK